jgi:hypothetical protein
LEEIVAAPVKKTENTTGGILCADHATPSIRKSWHYFAKKRRSLGRHSSLADQSHGVLRKAKNDFKQCTETCMITSQFSISFIAADWTFGIRFLGGALRSFSLPLYVKRVWDRLRILSDKYRGFVPMGKSDHRAVFPVLFQVVLLVRIERLSQKP